MTLWDRCFNGILIFAVVNFFWITLLEQYIPLVFGNLAGIAAAVCFVIWGPKPGGKKEA